jgi:hypothetical protein
MTDFTRQEGSEVSVSALSCEQLPPGLSPKRVPDTILVTNSQVYTSRTRVAVEVLCANVSPRRMLRANEYLLSGALWAERHGEIPRVLQHDRPNTRESARS